MVRHIIHCSPNQLGNVSPSYGHRILHYKKIDNTKKTKINEFCQECGQMGKPCTLLEAIQSSLAIVENHMEVNKN